MRYTIFPILKATHVGHHQLQGGLTVDKVSIYQKFYSLCFFSQKNMHAEMFLKNTFFILSMIIWNMVCSNIFTTWSFLSVCLKYCKSIHNKIVLQFFNHALIFCISPVSPSSILAINIQTCFLGCKSSMSLISFLASAHFLSAINDSTNKTLDS